MLICQLNLTLHHISTPSHLPLFLVITGSSIQDETRNEKETETSVIRNLLAPDETDSDIAAEEENAHPMIAATVITGQTNDTEVLHIDIERGIDHIEAMILKMKTKEADTLDARLMLTLVWYPILWRLAELP